MNIHTCPSRYGNEQTIITISINPVSISNTANELLRLRRLYPKAEFTFDQKALGLGVEDAFNAKY